MDVAGQGCGTRSGRQDLIAGDRVTVASRAGVHRTDLFSATTLVTFLCDPRLPHNA